MSLVELLLARAPSELARELSALDELEPALEALTRRGQASWPTVAVGEAAWADHLARHLTPGNIVDQLTAMRAEGVHLSLGCLAGNPHALAEFEGRLRKIARSALAATRLESVQIDEVLQDVRERLLVANDGAELPKLATYSGHGPLEGWLRVVLARAAVSSLRRRRPDARHDDAQALIEHAASDDPQLEALRHRCAPTLAHAIEDAIGALPDRDRVLLRLHMVDGLTIDDLAAVYGAHRATTARRLARVRNQIFRGARERAMKHLGVGESEFASLMGLMLSQLEVTISRLLRKADDGAPGEGDVDENVGMDAIEGPP